MKNSRRTSIIIALLYFTALAINAQKVQGVTHSGMLTGQPPFPIRDYAELYNPVHTDMQLWKNVADVYVSWGSTDIRYRKEEPVRGKVQTKLILKAWKGESVSSQLVVWGNRDLKKLSFDVSDLKHSSSSVSIIRSSSIFTGFVRYVMTDELNKDGRGGCGHRPEASFYDSTLVADPIDHLTKSLFVPAYSAQGCWVRVSVPADIQAGTYRGTVTVRDGSKVLGRLKIAVQVNERSLPEVSEWSFHLDLWQNPFAVARYHQVELWSDEHFKILKPYMEMYRDAGGKVITASIMHKPWNAQTYDYFESMVTWIKRLDGSWYFDYAVFDKWVQFMLDLGIKGQINCYSMVPWKLSFQYFDQASNQLKTLKTKPGEAEYEAIWKAMLKSFASHLKQKGWFGFTYISMDERPMEVMHEVIKVIREADPDFKISLAGALHEELSAYLDDYCVALRMKYSDELLSRRKAEGKVTTFYTSSEEPYPNTFTFAAPADSEWLGWYAAKANLDGYLRWALNSWVIEPLLDSRFYTWAAGDTYLIYPGARTSIRFERLKAGIQAYEKVRILRTEFKEKGNQIGLRTIYKALENFNEQKLEKTPSSVMVEQANRVINSF